MSGFVYERCCDGEFCGSWDSCRDKADRSPAPDPTPDEQAVIDRFDPFRRERVLADLQREIDRSIRRALGTDPGRC
jgi:hypothetical protein